MRTLTLFCYVRREKRGIQGTSESVERITAQVRGEEETCLRELSLGLTSRKRKIAANKGFLGSESLGTPFLYLRPRAIKLQPTPPRSNTHDGARLDLSLLGLQGILCLSRSKKFASRRRPRETPMSPAQRKRVISHKTVLSLQRVRSYIQSKQRLALTSIRLQREHPHKEEATMGPVFVRRRRVFPCPSVRWFSTSRKTLSSRSLLTWCTRTCLYTCQRCFLITSPASATSHTAGGCPVADIYVHALDRMDKCILGCCAPDHGGSSRSYA
jgi:hypothetical protein